MEERRTFSEAFDLLLKIQAPKSKNTFAQARCVVAHLKPWFSENAPHLDEFERSYEETWAEYRAWQATLLGRRGKVRRLAHDRRYLVMALKRAQAKGWITKSFSKKDFSLNEAHEPIGKYVSDSDVLKLLGALTIHPKTRLQVKMALMMGMRLSEVLKLKVEEVDLERKHIVLDPNRLKTRRPRQVPIPIANDVFPELAEYVRQAKGTCVFPMDRNPNEAQSDNRHWWSMARKKAGVKCRFHDLRHTWASNMVARGTPQDYIVKVGGFTAQVMSRVYSHMNEPATEEFRSAFDGRFKDASDRPRQEVLPSDSGGADDRHDSISARLLRAVRSLL